MISHPVEFTVKIRTEESKHSKKFLDYNPEIRFTPDDKYIQELIQETMKEFKTTSPVEEVQVTAKMVV